MSLGFCTGLVGTDFSGFRGEIVADHNHSFTPAAEQRREAEMSLSIAYLWDN